MVAKYIPDMQDALYSGHQGNRGDAILWGEALGAQTGDLGSFQDTALWLIPWNIDQLGVDDGRRYPDKFCRQKIFQ